MIQGRTFQFFKAGAPYPGICLSCSNVNNLWALGHVRGTNQVTYVCEDCLRDLALYAGYIQTTRHIEKVDELEEANKLLEKQLDAVPTILRKVNESVATILADLATDLAAIAISDGPLERKNPETISNPAKPDERNKPQAGERKKQGTRPSPESTSSQRTYRLSNAPSSNPQH